MQDLFGQTPGPGKTETSPSGKTAPLADRVRPRKLSDMVGQEHILGPGRVLRRAIERDELFSMILWGPPGVGKTTLARIIAEETRSAFFAISAVTTGVKDIRKILDQARLNLQRLHKRSILFIDEIHHFNKAQQDALLHEVEDGTIFLIGATTENPSFEVIAPLLSRCRVFQLQPLSASELEQIVDRAIQQDEVLSQYRIRFAQGAKETLIRLSGGDARMALNALELAFQLAIKPGQNEVVIRLSDVEDAYQSRSLYYDKAGDYHYDVISAFIKSIRGSDPDAALYWLARMIDAGEDPKFIARRLIILASEDIGNADPLALVLATSAFTAITYIGMPEGQLVLAQAATYLASAPKSNASYRGLMQALEDVKKGDLYPVPIHLRNAPTGLMAHLGYGKDYKYPHDYDGHFVRQTYLPEEIKGRIYYRPADTGQERQIRERLRKLWAKRQRMNEGEKEDGEGHRD
jgi:putative ATPase